ncbi:hypothetical protein EDC01DRAFT_731979 [Geopyxis carbonaria]|nr:hypothetical protein EDC01DRAFT_731979 [Geopyxis carbonaria]
MPIHHPHYTHHHRQKTTTTTMSGSNRHDPARMNAYYAAQAEIQQTRAEKYQEMLNELAHLRKQPQTAQALERIKKLEETVSMWDQVDFWKWEQGGDTEMSG